MYSTVYQYSRVCHTICRFYWYYIPKHTGVLLRQYDWLALAYIGHTEFWIIQAVLVPGLPGTSTTVDVGRAPCVHSKNTRYPRYRIFDFFTGVVISYWVMSHEHVQNPVYS
jgi:hypothetical protein